LNSALFSGALLVRASCTAYLITAVCSAESGRTASLIAGNNECVCYRALALVKKEGIRQNFVKLYWTAGAAGADPPTDDCRNSTNGSLKGCTATAWVTAS